MHRKQLEQHNYQHLSRLFRIELFYPGAVSVRLLCIFNKTNWNARAEEIPDPEGRAWRNWQFPCKLLLFWGQLQRAGLNSINANRTSINHFSFVVIQLWKGIPNSNTYVIEWNLGKRVSSRWLFYSSAERKQLNWKILRISITNKSKQNNNQEWRFIKIIWAKTKQEKGTYK